MARRRWPPVAVLVALLAGVALCPSALADEAPPAQEPSRGTEAPAPHTVTAYGSASDHGPGASLDPAAPLIDMAAHPSGDGYWLVASDGGVFSFGAARFSGSMGGRHLNEPIVGMAADPSGDGYWLVASDGGVFAFGSARFRGSTGGIDLRSRIVGMASHPSGDGYWLAAADGGVFSFGVEFFGSEGDDELAHQVVGIAPAANGAGYWLAARDGQVYAHGVTDHGSAAEHEAALEAPTVGIAAAGSDGYWLVHGPHTVIEAHDRGPRVEQIQRRLDALGYWLGPIDGIFGDLTEQAVYAFQKYEGLRVHGTVDAATAAALDRATRPSPRSAGGSLVEVDKTRQLLFVVREGQATWVFNTSTGTEEPYTYEGRTYLADTPPGDWEVSWEVDGYRTSNLGRLYRPKYFHRDGIAVHGYSFVPPYPASHGCVRVTNEAIDFIWANALLPIGTRVWVYGTSPR